MLYALSDDNHFSVVKWLLQCMCVGEHAFVM